MAYSINFFKEDFKFSSAHFTLFSASESERLHGHNYKVELELQAAHLNPETGMIAPAHEIKTHIRAVCESLDEYVLIPKKSKWLKHEVHESQLIVAFHNKHYSFPKEEAILLPLVNITTETLAVYVYDELKNKAPDLFSKIKVTVNETHGQGASYGDF